MKIIPIALLLLLTTGVRSQAAGLNVVMIVMDGLRADHMGCYGYGRKTSPHLDALAGDGVLFERAIAQATWTLPSFASFLTSQYIETVGITHQWQRLPENATTIASVLGAHGYKTAAFGAGPYVHELYGLDHGFQTMRSTKNNSFRDFSEVLAQARDYVELRRKGDPFFLLLHNNDLHPPFDIPARLPERITHPFFDGAYKGPMDRLAPDYPMFVKVFNGMTFKERGLASPFFEFTPLAPQSYFDLVRRVRGDSDEIRHLVAHYDERLSHSDRAIRQFWDFLREKKLDRNTILVVLADHGLEWAERGLICTGFHANGWETVLHVPLIIKHPSLKPARIPDVVQLIDVAPTLLDLLGIPSPRQFQGRSLAPLMRGDVKALSPRPAFADSTSSNTPNAAPVRTVHDRRWKLIRSEQPLSMRPSDLWMRLRGERRWVFQLYDLQNDPAERTDLASREPEIVSRLSLLLSERQRLNKVSPR